MIASAKVEYEGRKYTLVEHGYTEYDTNAWVETGECVVTYSDTGEEVSQTDLDRSVTVDWLKHGTVSLFEHLCHIANWEQSYDDDDSYDNY